MTPPVTLSGAVSAAPVLVDPDTLPAPIGRTGAAAQTAAQTAQGRPQLCPDPIPENTAGRSERAIAYQQQIAGLPPGLEVRLNAVGFDGCRETGGTMIEAKGPGYADKMTGDTTWQGWFTGDEEIEAQMQRQARAAAAPIARGTSPSNLSLITSATTQSEMV